MNSGRSSHADGALGYGKPVVGLHWTEKAASANRARPPRSMFQRIYSGVLAGCMTLAVVAPAPAAAASFGFTAPLVHQIRDIAQALTIGDVSGDSRDDLVVFVGKVNSNEPSHLLVYVQRNDGSLALPQQIQLSARMSVDTSLGIGDFNGDQRNDIVVGLGYGLLILIADGQGGFLQGQFVDDHLTTVEAIADINGDGNLDVLSTGIRENTVLLGDGSGFFGSRIIIASGEERERLAYGDVTGDGHGDIVAIDFYLVSVAAGDGHGNFAPRVEYSPTLAISNGSLAIGNFLGDGRNELAVAKSNYFDEPGLFIYQQDESGALQAPILLTGREYTTGVASIARDLDGDGRQDLLVAYNGSVGVYLHGPDGLADTPSIYNVNFQWAWAGFASGDLNNDGCPDVALADFVVSTMYGICEDGQTDSDYDGDGVADLLWHNAASGAGSIWRSANYATQQSLTRVTSPDWRIVATGDFDGDALADIVWHNQVTGAGTIWKAGRSATQQGLTRITDLNWKIVGAGDYDGDGRDDLLWRHAVNGKNAIWKGGNFATQQAINAVTDVRWQPVGSGDFNGDGRSDILWRHATTGGNAIWRSGNYQNQQPVTAITNIDWKVGAIGDFDGDGSDDLFWRHLNGSNTIWRAAAYARQLAVAKQPTRWILAAAADYDGNGRDDIAWRNTVDGSNLIWGSANAADVRSLTTVPDQNWRIHQ